MRKQKLTDADVAKGIALLNLSPTRRSAKTKAPVLQLVPRERSQDTLRCLSDLLHDAATGDIVGVAYIAITKEGYAVGLVGDARRRATYTRGTLPTLDAELDKLIRG